MATHQPADPYAWQQPAPPPRAKSGNLGRVLLFVLALIVTCAGGVALGVTIAPSKGEPSSSVAQQAPAGESMIGGSATPRVEVAQPEVDDGTWSVPADIPAGTYRTTANVSSSCYWEISKTGSTGLLDIVANDLPGGGRPQVKLKAGQTFKTQRCGTWRKS